MKDHVKDARKLSGEIMRTNATLVTEMCRLLHSHGAGQEEVDVILGTLNVPLNPTDEDALRARTWYCRQFLEADREH